MLRITQIYSEMLRFSQRLVRFSRRRQKAIPMPGPSNDLALLSFTRLYEVSGKCSFFRGGYASRR
jgi:hypothetical protein